MLCKVNTEMKRQRKLRNTDITRPTDVPSISGSVQQLPLAIVSNLDNAQTNESAVELKTKRKLMLRKGHHKNNWFFKHVFLMFTFPAVTLY